MKQKQSPSKQHQNQNDYEGFYLQMFLDMARISYKEIKRGESFPDFVIAATDGRIDLELTDFHTEQKGDRGHPRRALESAWDRYRQRIHEQLRYSSKSRGVSGLLILRGLDLPPKKDAEKFVNEIVAFVEGVVDDLAEYKDKEFRLFPESSLMDAYLSKLYLRRSGFCDWGWNHMAGSVGLRESELLEIIRPKMVKSRDGGCWEFWLLVVSGPSLSQCMGSVSPDQLDAFDELDKELRQGPYDKVFVLQYVERHLFVWTRERGWHAVE